LKSSKRLLRRSRCSVAGRTPPDSGETRYHELVPDTRNHVLSNRIATPSDCRQRPAYSLQSLAEHFRVHSHADTEVIGQTEKMSGHG
jgi:hypothetical protein